MAELRLLERLNDETQPHHSEADSDLDRYLFRPEVTPADYRTYLVRLYGFAAPVEAALVATPGLGELIDLRARLKTPMIVHDLLALGMSLPQVEELPQCLSVPVMKGCASALGWLYVLERPMLASAVLRGHLATHLPTEMAYASAYLACYAGQVGSVWRELGEVMDQLADTTAVADRIVMAAHDAFRCQNRWRLHAGNAHVPPVLAAV